MYMVCRLFFICAIAASIADARLPFNDDFTDIEKSKSSWTAAHGPVSYEPGRAVIGKAEVGQSARLTLKDSGSLKDYAVEFQIQFRDTLSDRGHAGVRVRHTDDSLVYIYLTPTGKGLLWHGHGPTAVKGISINPQEPQLMRIVCNAANIEIYLNGKLEQTLYDVESLEGGIDLFAHECSATFSAIKVSAVSARTDSASASSRNIVSNSGFEEATAPNLPDHWGTQSWSLGNDDWVHRRAELWSLWKRDNVNAYEGNYSMRVDGIIHLASTYVHPRVGRNYTLSAWLRAEVDDVPVKVIYYNYPSGAVVEHTVRVTSDWARYEVPVDTIDRDRGFIGFHRTVDGPFWVDAVQMEQGGRATEYVAGGRATDGAVVSTPVLSAVMADEAVAIDGRLNEGIWQNVKWHALVLPDGGAPTQPAEAAIAFSDDALLIAFRCHDSDMDSVIASVTDRDGAVWKDDAVEIFLDTAGTRERYFHLGLSITGAQYDGLKIDPSWNAEWESAVARQSDGWTVEIAIPFRSLNLAVQDQGAWRINLARENGKAGEVSSVSPSFGSFHNMERFAELQPLPRDVLGQWLVKPVASAEQDYAGVPFPFGGGEVIPFGLAWQSEQLPGRNAFSAMKAAGFNASVVFFDSSRKTDDEIRTTLDEAQRNGIGIVYWVGAFGEPTEEHLEKIQYAVETFREHPAIRAWMVLDEPHNNPHIVTEAWQLAKRLDPDRPAMINLTSHGLGMRLAGLPGDVIAVDSYGIHFDSTSIADIGPLLRRAGMEAAEGDRPVFVFIQGMANMLMVWRGPTPAEQTSQTYISLVNGATAIFYFTAFPLAEDTWQRTIELAAEIEALTPLLLHGEPAPVAVSAPQIEFTSRLLDGKLYVIATNPTAHALEVGFDLADAGAAGSAQVLFENRQVQVEGGQWSDQFPPHSRHVYQIDRQP